MFCPNCRKELPEGTKFCGGCGTPIAVSQAPAAPAQPVPASDFAEPVSPMSYEAPVAAPVKPAEKGADVKAILNNIKNTVVDTVKKIPSKYLKIGAAAVAVVLLIVLLVRQSGMNRDQEQQNHEIADYLKNFGYDVFDELDAQRDANTAAMQQTGGRINAAMSQMGQNQTALLESMQR